MVQNGSVPRSQHLAPLPEDPLSWTEAAWRNAGFEDVGIRVMSLGAV